MPIRVATNLSITLQLDCFITAQIASGRYQNASKVMRAALWLREWEEIAQACKRTRFAGQKTQHA